MSEYTNHLGDYMCMQCAAGTFKNKTGSNVCMVCDAGKYTPVAGCSTCIDCPTGTFANTTGTRLCASCAAGTYSMPTVKKIDLRFPSGVQVDFANTLMATKFGCTLCSEEGYGSGKMYEAGILACKNHAIQTFGPDSWLAFGTKYVMTGSPLEPRITQLAFIPSQIVDKTVIVSTDTMAYGPINGFFWYFNTMLLGFAGSAEIRLPKSDGGF